MAKSYTSRPADKRSVRLDLDRERHEEFRVAAAKAGMPMSRFAAKLILDFLDRGRGASGPERPP